MYEFAPPQAVAWKPFGVPPEYGPENVPLLLSPRGRLLRVPALRHLLRRLVHAQVVVRAVPVRMAGVDVLADDGLLGLRLGRVRVRRALLRLLVGLLVGDLGSLLRRPVRLGHLARRLAD